MLSVKFKFQVRAGDASCEPPVIRAQPVGIDN